MAKIIPLFLQDIVSFDIWIIEYFWALNNWVQEKKYWNIIFWLIIISMKLIALLISLCLNFRFSVNYPNFLLFAIILEKNIYFLNRQIFFLL